MPIEIYVTFPNRLEAEKITNQLLKNRLVACATFFPITSRYWWQGKLSRSKEIAAFLITTNKNWLKTKTEIKKMHSYQVPCIKKIKFEANKEYENWVKDVTK
ncbi:MAG: divalent cation tolerance protein CutA [Patescibacteria group bacterium]